MFRHPENEYDWLTSDAAVDEAIHINAYTFTDAGLRESHPHDIVMTTEAPNYSGFHNN